MPYTLGELRQLILLMIVSQGSRSPEELADGIVELIKQDREAHANPVDGHA